MIIKNNRIRQITKFALAFSDIISVFIPALFIYTFLESIDGHLHIRIRTIFGIIFFTIMTLFCTQTIFEQYSIRRSFYDEFKELLHIFLINGLAALAAIFIFDFSTHKEKHLLFLCSVFVLLPILRNFTRLTLDYFGLWRLQCVMFCPQSEFKYAQAAIESQFNLGMIIIRSVVERRIVNNLVRDVRLSHSDKLSFLKNEINDYYLKLGDPHIILFAHRKNSLFIPKLIDLIMHCDLPYSIIPDVGGASLLGMRISHFFRWELLLITPQHNIARLSYRLIKRLVDIILSIILILLLLLPMIIIFLLIKKDGGPGFFLHERVGYRGQKFGCLKFRTMHTNSDDIIRKYFTDNPSSLLEWCEFRKLQNDPRITNFGRFLRQTSLDELPQLFNVLLGHMSLVGPRPIIESEIPTYGWDIEMYYKVRPGMTGLWQISGRSNTSYGYRVSMDMWYIKNWSIWYDIGILLKTITVVITKVGAK